LSLSENFIFVTGTVPAHEHQAWIGEGGYSVYVSKMDLNGKEQLRLNYPGETNQNEQSNWMSIEGDTLLVRVLSFSVAAFDTAGPKCEQDIILKVSIHDMTIQEIRRWSWLGLGSFPGSIYFQHSQFAIDPISKSISMWMSPKQEPSFMAPSDTRICGVDGTYWNFEEMSESVLSIVMPSKPMLNPSMESCNVGTDLDCPVRWVSGVVWIAPLVLTVSLGIGLSTFMDTQRDPVGLMVNDESDTDADDDDDEDVGLLPTHAKMVVDPSLFNWSKRWSVIYFWCTALLALTEIIIFLSLVVLPGRVYGSTLAVWLSDTGIFVFCVSLILQCISIWTGALFLTRNSSVNTICRFHQWTWISSVAIVYTAAYAGSRMASVNPELRYFRVIVLLIVVPLCIFGVHVTRELCIHTDPLFQRNDRRHMVRIILMLGVVPLALDACTETLTLYQRYLKIDSEIIVVG